MDGRSGNLWFQTSVCCLEVYVRSRQELQKHYNFELENTYVILEGFLFYVEIEIVTA